MARGESKRDRWYDGLVVDVGNVLSKMEGEVSAEDLWKFVENHKDVKDWLMTKRWEWNRFGSVSERRGQVLYKVYVLYNRKLNCIYIGITRSLLDVRVKRHYYQKNSSGYRMTRTWGTIGCVIGWAIVENNDEAVKKMLRYMLILERATSEYFFRRTKCNIMNKNGRAVLLRWFERWRKSDDVG